MEFVSDCVIDDQVTGIERPRDRDFARQQSFTALNSTVEEELQQTPPPPPYPCAHKSCIISGIRGLRNGLYYGGKVRFAHSIVMSLLFQKNVPILDRLRLAIKLSWQHGRNLGTFVLIYKLTQCALYQFFDKQHSGFAFLAGMVGAFFVWRDHNSINQQICYYLLSRVIEGLFKKARDLGYLPDIQIFGAVSMLCWGIVMFLFEEDRSVL